MEREISSVNSLSQLAQMGAEIISDNRLYLEAEGFLKSALSYSPARQQIVYSLSGIESALGKNEEAISMLDKTIVADPKIAEGYWRLALVYQMSGQGDKAMEVINRANDNKVKWDKQGESVVAQILLQQQSQNQIKK